MHEHSYCIRHLTLPDLESFPNIEVKGQGLALGLRLGLARVSISKSGGVPFSIYSTSIHTVLGI